MGVSALCSRSGAESGRSICFCESFNAIFLFQNGKLALNCDRTMQNIFQKVSTQNESVKKLEMLVSHLPHLREKLNCIMKVLSKCTCRLIEISMPITNDSKFETTFE